MTTKPKTRKAAAPKASARKRRRPTMAEAAAMDFAPWEREASRVPSLEEINNPHMVYCYLAYLTVCKTKAQLITMFEDNDKLLTELIYRMDASSKFFNTLSELIDLSIKRLIIAGCAVNHAEAA
jgi:hypothetical protein